MTEIINNANITNIFQGNFELINSGAANGKFNMDFDYQRTLAIAENKALPMFRLYSWNPWCLSLGANQKEDEIDLTALNNMGYDLVRRPTGGRAVFHSQELTYSVALRLPDGMNVHDIYREIHIVILNAMKRFTNKVDFEKSQPNFRDFYQNNSASTACFASSARYEIVSDKRKIVGSAQRLYGSVLLQHGSILLNRAHEELANLVKVKDENSRDKLKEIIRLKSVSLSELAEREISVEEFKSSMIDEITKK